MGAGDRDRWDARYAGDGYLHGTDPAPFLVEQRHLLPAGGRALDVAAGEGQNAVFLAEQGLDVTAIDISSAGLRKARQLAEGRGVAVRTRLWDLSSAKLPDGPFDVAVCLHYKQRALAPRMAEVLTPGGLLFIELCTVANLALHRRPSRRFLVEPNELLGWFPTLSLVSYQEGVFGGRAVARLVARRPG